MDYVWQLIGINRGTQLRRKLDAYYSIKQHFSNKL